MLVRDWHNPEAWGARAAAQQTVIFIHTDLYPPARLRSRGEETALERWENISMIQTWAGLPGAGAGTALNPVRRKHWWEGERERNATDYEASSVLVPCLSALFPSNVGGKNPWREG